MTFRQKSIKDSRQNSTKMTAQTVAVWLVAVANPLARQLREFADSLER
jgi:hypothetical protein